MKREEYRSLLGQLPKKCPTTEDMAKLCPHITAEQAVIELTAGKGYVACPPILITDSFQVICLCPEWVEQIRENGIVIGQKNHPAQLERLNASRPLDSSYQYEAKKFAQDNWGNELSRPIRASFIKITIADPNDLVNDYYHKDCPRTKAILYVSLGRDYSEIINDHSRPTSELIDEVISFMTLDVFAWHELKGGQGSNEDTCCANCGAGLAVTACPNCGLKFSNQFKMRNGATNDKPFYLSTGGNSYLSFKPLSRKMVAFLQENGHKFNVDPQKAWSAELTDWESQRSKSTN